MPEKQDIKILYESKCQQFDELSEQFNELQEQSTLIMNDMEDQIKQLKRKNQLLDREVRQLKQKKKYITSTIERQLDQAQKEKNQFKNKFKDFEKKVIELEIINQDLENELRATKSTLEQYQASAQKTMEELAILRIQLQESTNSNQQQIARLRQQLKQTEEQITVMHKKTKKNEAQTSSQLNKKQTIYNQHQLPPPNIKRPQPTHIENVHHHQPAKKDAFKQTLRGILDYLQSIDVRKEEIRKALLMHKQFVSSPYS